MWTLSPLKCICVPMSIRRIIIKILYCIWSTLWIERLLDQVPRFWPQVCLFWEVAYPGITVSWVYGQTDKFFIVDNIVLDSPALNHIEFNAWESISHFIFFWHKLSSASIIISLIIEKTIKYTPGRQAPSFPYSPSKVFFVSF